jgi:hypothetical protein
MLGYTSDSRRHELPCAEWWDVRGLARIIAARALRREPGDLIETEGRRKATRKLLRFEIRNPGLTAIFCHRSRRGRNCQFVGCEAGEGPNNVKYDL